MSVCISHISLRYGRVRRFFVGLWRTVWTVLLLVYLHTVHASLSVLNCVDVPIGNHTETVSVLLK